VKNYLLILGLVGATAAHAAAPHQKVVVKADVGIDRSKSPPRVVVRLAFYDGTPQPENIITDRILKVNDQVKSTDSYTLRRGKETISLEEVKLRNYDSDEQTAGAVELVPKENLKADADYCIEVKPSVWHFVAGVTPPSEECCKVSKDELKTELEYATHRELKNKAELKSGSTAGAGSLRYTYNYDSPLSQYPSWLHFEALAKSAFNLRSEDRTKYFNSLVAQVSGFYVNSWNAPTVFGGNSDQRKSPYYVGISGNLESDQTFSTVDSTAGLQLRTFVRNPITDLFYLLLVHGDAKTTEAGIKPRFELGYAYVDHIKQGVDTHSGNERLTAGFSWWMPILRNQGLRPLISDRVVDADFLIDLGGIYDIEKTRFTNTTTLSFEVHWRKALEHASDKDPAFTLSYAQGKATPTFKNFDAFLAGVKLPF